MAESTLNGQKFSERITQIIEANLQNEQFGVTQLAREMKMSHSSLHRKVRKTFHKSASQYISHKRLNKARLTVLCIYSAACGYIHYNLFMEMQHFSAFEINALEPGTGNEAGIKSKQKKTSRKL